MSLGNHPSHIWFGIAVLIGLAITLGYAAIKGLAQAMGWW